MKKEKLTTLLTVFALMLSLTTMSVFVSGCSQTPDRKSERKSSNSDKDADEDKENSESDFEEEIKEDLNLDTDDSEDRSLSESLLEVKDASEFEDALRQAGFQDSDITEFLSDNYSYSWVSATDYENIEIMWMMSDDAESKFKEKYDNLLTSLTDESSFSGTYTNEEGSYIIYDGTYSGGNRDGLLLGGHYYADGTMITVTVLNESGREQANKFLDAIGYPKP